MLLLRIDTVGDNNYSSLQDLPEVRRYGDCLVLDLVSGVEQRFQIARGKESLEKMECPG
jgi:hypothetical protein